MKKNKSLKGKKVVQGVYVEKSNMNVSLDDLLGEKTVNPFGTTSEAEFQEQLDEMNLQDMEVLGTKVDLRPVHDRRIMKERLTKAFRVEIGKLNKPSLSAKNKNRPLSARRQSLAEEILSEGK